MQSGTEIVAGKMSEIVVDAFERIQIQKQHLHGIVSLFQHISGILQQIGTVLQPGQGVISHSFLQTPDAHLPAGDPERHTVAAHGNQHGGGNDEHTDALMRYVRKRRIVQKDRIQRDPDGDPEGINAQPRKHALINFKECAI